MHNSRRNSGNKRPEINITPLVDVMLVLLVIFMVVSPSMHSDIEVRVPKTHNSSNVDTSQNDLIKIIIAPGKLFINEKEISQNELANELNGFDKNLTIIVKADKNLPYEVVFSILDKLKNAGYHNIALVGVVE